MRRLIAHVLWSSIAVLGTVAPGSAHPEGEGEQAPPTTRMLKDHIFLPSPFLASPFSTTHLGSSTMYAVATATGPQFNVQGQVIGGSDYSMAAFGNEVNYQLRLADWFAFRVYGNAIVFSGITGPAALAIGASFRYNFGLGITAGLPLGQSVRLAFVADVGYQPAFDLTIGSAILRAIQTQSFQAGENAFISGTTVQLRPGLSVAWAPHKNVGLQAELRYVRTEVDKSGGPDTASADAVDFAALIDVNLGSLPIALTGLYRRQEPTSTGNQAFRIEDAGLGIFYTGRPHFAAGLTITQQWFDVRPNLDTEAMLAHLIMRYYW